MTFWTNRTIEPKRSYRWIAYIHFFENSYAADVASTDPDAGAEPEEVNTFPFLVHSFTKPEFGFDVQEIKDSYGPHRRTFSSSGKWGPLSIKVYDVSNKKFNFTRIFNNWLSKIGYKSGQESTSQDWVDASKAVQKLSSGDFIAIFLNHIDSNGKKIEEWKFESPVIKAVSFGKELSYTSDEPVLVELGFEIASAKYAYLADAKN